MVREAETQQRQNFCLAGMPKEAASQAETAMLASARTVLTGKAGKIAEQHSAQGSWQAARATGAEALCHGQDET
jgi:hypothetical protein